MSGRAGGPGNAGWYRGAHASSLQRGRGVWCFGGGDVRAGRSEGELPRARARGARVLARGRRVPPPARAAQGGPALGLLRGSADRERAAGDPPHRVPDVQGRLPPLQGDDGSLRSAQGRLGLPRPPGRARGREGDRDEDQAGHRGVRDRRVQPAVSRVGPAVRGRVRTPDGAPGLLDRHGRRVLDHGHRVHRERVVVAQAASREGVVVPGRSHHHLLPAMRHAAVRRRGGDGLRRRRGPERLHPVPHRRSAPPLARRSLDARVDDHAVDADLQHRARGQGRRRVRGGRVGGRAAGPGRGATRRGPAGCARGGRPDAGERVGRDPVRAAVPERRGRPPRRGRRLRLPRGRNRRRPPGARLRRRGPRDRQAGRMDDVQAPRRRGQVHGRGAGIRPRHVLQGRGRSHRRGPAVARAAAAGGDDRPQLSPVLAVRDAADLRRAELLVRANDRRQGPAARSQRGGRLVSGAHQARALRRLAREQRGLGAVARTLLGHPAADLAMRPRTRHRDRVARRTLRPCTPRRDRDRPSSSRDRRGDGPVSHLRRRLAPGSRR